MAMDVNKVLETAPAKIAELANGVEESRFIWKCCEIQLSQMQARLHLECKAQNPDLTQSDLKAKVEESNELYEKKMECLTLESAHKKACINVDKWVNAFTSARKMASVKIEEMRSLNDVIIKKGGNQ